MAIPLIVVGGAVILLLLLFLLASPTFRRAMHDTISGVPLIGAWLAENNERLIVFLYGQLATWANAALGALSSLLEILAGLEYETAQQLLNFTSATHETLLHLRNVVIPAAVRQAEAYGEARLGAVSSELGQRIQAARALAAAEFAAALARADREYVQAVGYAQTLAVWSAAYAGRLWASATGYAQGLFAQAVNESRAGEARAESYAAAEATQGVEFTRQAYASAIGYADWVGQTAEGYAEALTGGAIRQAEGENARTLAYATAAATALAAAVAAIENSPCMQRCMTLGQLGAELEGLDAIALAALVIEATRDPQAFAREFQAEFGPVIEIVRETLAGLGAPVGTAA